MTSPTLIVSAAEVDRLLGLDGGIDETRAEEIIGWVQTLALDVVDPLPDGAAPVILRVAGRVYMNPTAAALDMSGDRSVQYVGAIGLALDRRDKKDLRRAAGRSGGAFTVNVEADDVGDLIPPWGRDEGYQSPDDTDVTDSIP